MYLDLNRPERLALMRSAVAASSTRTTPFLPDEMPAPPRVEDIEPEVAALFRQVAAREHPLVKSLYLSPSGVHIMRKPVRAVQTAGRNDPCPCGSGKKFKKCCG